MAQLKDFTYTIMAHIATLSESKGITKELNLISYGNSRPKLDLRSWQENADGERKMLKGLTLTPEEAAALKKALEVWEGKQWKQ